MNATQALTIDVPQIGCVRFTYLINFWRHCSWCGCKRVLLWQFLSIFKNVKFVVLSSKMSARNKTAVLVTPATRVLEFGTKLFCVEGTLLMCKVCNLLQCQCISGLTLRTILETFVFFLQSLFNVYRLVTFCYEIRTKNKQQVLSVLHIYFLIKTSWYHAALPLIYIYIQFFVRVNEIRIVNACMLDLKQVIPQPIVEFCCGRGFLPRWAAEFMKVRRGIFLFSPRKTVVPSDNPPQCTARCTIYGGHYTPMPASSITAPLRSKNLFYSITVRKSVDFINEIGFHC